MLKVMDLTEDSMQGGLKFAVEIKLKLLKRAESKLKEANAS